MRKHSILASALLLALTTGCVGDQLDVTNLNNPDVERAYATPDGIEGVIAGLGVQLNNPQRANESVNTQGKIFAGENFATVNNFGMAPRAALPRGPVSNELGNDIQAGNLANYNSFQRIARTAVNGIQAVDRLVASGGSLGSPARNARAKAFAFLILGQALGYVSFGYDSAAILVATTPSSDVPPLSGAAAVGAAAVQMLDSAIAIATSANATNGSGGFPLPSTWINGTSYSRDEFVRLARSYRARIRAGVARTPAERAAVNWQLVIADATNGITADHVIALGAGSGWAAQYDAGQMYVLGGWHTVPMFYYGMADTSGAYETWLRTARDSRRAFTVVTPDTRWPSGETRAAQQAQASTNVLPAGRYFRNRPTGDDVVGASWGESQYDHRRYGATQAAGGAGPYTDMSKTEIDMLAAEGYIRTGQLPQAVALIDASRVKNGLPAIGSVASASAPISTGAGCIPRVPQPPSFTTTACGSVLEAMKYEKRMETAFTGYMIWFTDNRGWGDLIATTPIEWPVPYQELQARQKPIYNGLKQAGVGTYGFQ